VVVVEVVVMVMVFFGEGGSGIEMRWLIALGWVRLGVRRAGWGWIPETGGLGAVLPSELAESRLVLRGRFFPVGAAVQSLVGSSSKKSN
jgi:hypothetical protein